MYSDKLYADVLEVSNPRIKISDIESLYLYAKVSRGNVNLKITTVGILDQFISTDKIIKISNSSNTVDTHNTMYHFNSDSSTTPPHDISTSKHMNKLLIDDIEVNNLDSVQDETVAFIEIETDFAISTKLLLFNFGLILKNGTEKIIKYDSSDYYRKTVIKYLDRNIQSLIAPKHRIRIRNKNDNTRWIHNTTYNDNTNPFSQFGLPYFDNDGITIKKTQYYSVSFKVRINLVSNEDINNKLIMEYLHFTGVGVEKGDNILSEFFIKNNGNDEQNFVTLYGSTILYLYVHDQLNFFVETSHTTTTEFLEINIMELN